MERNGSGAQAAARAFQSMENHDGIVRYWRQQCRAGGASRPLACLAAACCGCYARGRRNRLYFESVRRIRFKYGRVLRCDSSNSRVMPV